MQASTKPQILQVNSINRLNFVVLLFISLQCYYLPGLQRFLRSFLDSFLNKGLFQKNIIELMLELSMIRDRCCPGS